MLVWAKSFPYATSVNIYKTLQMVLIVLVYGGKKHRL